MANGTKTKRTKKTKATTSHGNGTSAAVGENQAQPPTAAPLEEAKPPRVLSIDPGVRTFATCYDSSGYLYEWGNGDKSRLMRLGHAMDKLQSRCSDGTCRHKERYKLRQKMGRIQEKIRNLVDDLQRKCIKWIVTNFTHVILPPFNGHNMNSKGQRKIRSKTVRSFA